MKHTPLLPLLLLSSLPGCVTRPMAPDRPTVPLGIYRYSASVEGNSLGGIIELGYMLVVTTQKAGVCRSTVPVRRMYLVQNKAGKLRITCGETVVLQWNASGEMLPYAEVLAPIVEEQAGQGTCLRWGTSARGQTRCLEWDRRPVITTRWAKGLATVSRDN